MKTEKQLQDYVKHCAKENDMLFLKMSSESRRGFPDVMLALNGNVIFLELKSPAKTGRLSKLQINLHNTMRKHGLKIYVVKSKDEADEIIREFING